MGSPLATLGILLLCKLQRYSIILDGGSSLMPDSCCQFETMEAPESILTVSKKSSWIMWYCGETKPVVKFKTSDTDLAWNGEGPRLTPSRALGFHFGIDCPCYKGVAKAKMWHPNFWWSLILGAILTPENSSIFEIPPLLVGTVFITYAAVLNA